MGSAQTIEGRPAVAFFGTSSLESDLKALEWALKHMPVSVECKLRIIHVSELKNANHSQKKPGSEYDHETLEKKFPENYPDYPGVAEVQTIIYAVKEHICGVTYEGENFEKALQQAIKEERLDALVLACWAADDRKGPPINTLESEGCSIFLVNVGSTKLTLSVASTEVSAATAAAPPSSMAPALRSGNATHPTSSNKANPDGHETGTTAEPKNVPNSSRTPKRSDKAQSATAASKTDTGPTIREKTQ